MAAGASRPRVNRPPTLPMPLLRLTEPSMSIEMQTETTQPAIEYSTTAVMGGPLSPEPVVVEEHEPSSGLSVVAWIGIAVVTLGLLAAIVYGIVSRNAAEHHLTES